MHTKIASGGVESELFDIVTSLICREHQHIRMGGCQQCDFLSRMNYVIATQDDERRRMTKLLLGHIANGDIKIQMNLKKD